MKRSFFHKGLYLESLRQLRVPAAVMLILFTVFEAFALVMEILSPSYYSGYTSFTEMHPSLYVMPYIVPVVLVMVALRYQTIRRDSDFYHSLPVSKLGMSLSAFAAAVTWMVAIIVLSSVVLGCLGSMTQIPALIESYASTVSAFERSFIFIFREVSATVLASLLAAVLLFLASMLCGTTFSSLAVAAILLLSPYLLTEALVGFVIGNVSAVFPTIVTPTYGFIFTDYTVNPFGYNLLLSADASDRETIGVWIGTCVWIVVAFAAAVWCAHRRPSETAGSASVSPALQTSFRILLALVCSLPAVELIVDGYVDFLSLGLIYLFATAAYFLFELATTKKVKNLVKAIPWYGVFVALHIVCILGVNMATNAILNYRPTADQISGVSIVSINHGMNLGDEIDICIRASKLERYSALYADSECAEVVLSDEASKRIVCDALEAACKHAAKEYTQYCLNGCGDLRHNDTAVYYAITVKFHDGLIPATREVRVSDSELRSLLTAVNSQEELPVLSPGGYAAYSPLINT